MINTMKRPKLILVALVVLLALALSGSGAAWKWDTHRPASHKIAGWTWDDSAGLYVDDGQPAEDPPADVEGNGEGMGWTWDDSTTDDGSAAAEVSAV